MRGDVAIEVVDQRGVETLLRLERRSNEAPDESSKPAFQRSVGGRRALGKNIPRRVQVGDPRRVVRSRRR